MARDWGRRRIAILLVASSAVVVSATLIYSLSSQAGERSPADSVVLVATAIAAILTVASTAITVFSRVTASHKVQIKVALGGAPNSGKTMLATLMILLLSGLAGGRRWTATPETERAVSRGERTLAGGFRSVPTRENEILHFETHVTLPQSGISRVLNGPAELELDIIDSAGELWQRLGDEGRQRDGSDRTIAEWSGALGQIPLVESTYFVRVAAAHAMVYLISAEDILSDSERVHMAAIDAVSALRMLRAERRETHSREIPINFMIVVSKGDLLDARQSRVLTALLQDRGEFSPLAFGLDASSVFSQSVREIERLVALSEAIADRRGGCVISSLETAVDHGLVRTASLTELELPSDVMERLRRRESRPRIAEVGLLDPLRWVLGQELGGRYVDLI